MNLQFFCFRTSLLCLNLSFFRIIYFIADQKDNQIIASNLPSLLNPPLYILKRLPISNVIAYNSHTRIINIRRDQWSKSFLPSRVPQLQPHHFVIYLQCFVQKVYTDCCLYTMCESRNKVLPYIWCRKCLEWNEGLSLFFRLISRLRKQS